MPDHAWNCINCSENNPPFTNICSNCKTPAPVESLPSSGNSIASGSEENLPIINTQSKNFKNILFLISKYGFYSISILSIFSVVLFILYARFIHREASAAGGFVLAIVMSIWAITASITLPTMAICRLLNASANGKSPNCAQAEPRKSAPPLSPALAAVRIFLWIVGAIGFIGLIAVSILAFSKLFAFAAGLILITGLTLSGLLEDLEKYMPGGSKNSYRKNTVDKPNHWPKLSVWLSGVCIAIAIWGICIWALQSVS